MTIISIAMLVAMFIFSCIQGGGVLAGFAAPFQAMASNPGLTLVMLGVYLLLELLAQLLRILYYERKLKEQNEAAAAESQRSAINHT